MTVGAAIAKRAAAVFDVRRGFVLRVEALTADHQARSQDPCTNSGAACHSVVISYQLSVFSKFFGQTEPRTDH
jgi:hypothetical protein